MFDDGAPIFTQLADRLCTEIVSGTYPDGTQVPSINELAVFYRINPATANRAIALLVDRGVLIKRRGIGMFVADGAHQALIAERRQALVDKYVRPLVAEARALGIDGRDVIALIQKEVNP